MNIINDLIAVVTVGTPARHGSLSVFPLRSAARHATAAYLVLDDALATGRFPITEVSEAGLVPQLLAINDTGSQVFLLDGEELVGAKQNRVLNLSIMLAPKSKTEIPVSCVEAGRWRAESDSFRTEQRVQFARGRARKIEQVSRSLRMRGEAMSDQIAIWNEISEKSARMDVQSPTGAMAALFESRNDDFRNYLDAIPTFDGQIGAAYAIGETLLGIDVFDSDATFTKLAPKLLSSYALDAMEVERLGAPPDSSVVNAFIQSVRAAAHQPSTTVGIGEMVRLSAEDLVGAALQVDGCCVHLAAFRRQAFEDHRRDQSPPKARMTRSSARARRR
jgi:hypothetical protein